MSLGQGPNVNQMAIANIFLLNTYTTICQSDFLFLPTEIKKLNPYFI